MFRSVGIIVAAGLAFCMAAQANPVLPPEFSIDITAIVEPVAPGEGLGYAGIGFDGTHFWLSRWASARITRITPAGEFVDSFDIPGLTGTRAMTWDGTHFWMANNTTTLSRVDPNTQTVVSTITVPSTARYLSYDPTADNGQGGFWIGNFNDDIQLVNMLGVSLTVLPAAGIGFTGRYGVALDFAQANPKLWTYFQGGAGSNMELGSISLPDGTGSLETIDLFPFLAPSTSGLAGGAFITDLLPGGQKTLLTLCQCTPNNILLGTLLQETYTVGGSLSGLADGASVVLQNNLGDDLTLSALGPFSFATELPELAEYSVTVLTQPTDPSQTCTVANGSGTLGAADVSDVVVNCVTDTYTVTPSVSAGGSITPDTPQTVAHGETTDFTLATTAGFYLSDVAGSCGGNLLDTVYTTAPIIADCDVDAMFLPQIPTTTSLQPSANPVRIGQSTSFDVTVSGSSAPTDGQVVVTASTGESCADAAPPKVNGSSANFKCSISFATLGPRTLSAAFSGSVMYLDSSSMPLSFSVARFADLSVSVSDGLGVVPSGQAVSYLVEVRNSGPDDAPGSLLVLASTPELLNANWTCKSLGAGTCPSSSGIGELGDIINLPAGAALDFLQNGDAASPLDSDLSVNVNLTGSSADPNFVFDPDSGNNQASDVNLAGRIFADGFEN